MSGKQAELLLSSREHDAAGMGGVIHGALLGAVAWSVLLTLALFFWWA